MMKDSGSFRQFALLLHVAPCSSILHGQFQLANHPLRGSAIFGGTCHTCGKFSARGAENLAWNMLQSPPPAGEIAGTHII